MDGNNQKRPLRLASNTARSIMTRSQSSATVAHHKTDLSKFTFSKRKAESPVKMLTKKSVFRDLTNRETSKEVTHSKVNEDQISAAAKKLASTKLHEQIAKKTAPALRKVKVAAKKEGIINNYFKVTKQPTRIVSSVVDSKSKRLDETKSQSSISILSIRGKQSSEQTTLNVETELCQVQILEKENRESTNAVKDSETAPSINSAPRVSGSPSLYVTALEDLSSTSDETIPGTSPAPILPKGVTDFDAENWDDPLQVSQYATDIFNYFKSLERTYQIHDYMLSQKEINTGMRAIVVDWMVELQENFELNHETLYLAVKLVDTYMSRKPVLRSTLQLVAAAAVFIASKYDERFPPSIDDTLHVCEGAYSRKQLLDMEINILKTVDFNLGFPLSYRYLRRYARYGRISMQTLTLARYILECSLMDYSFVSESDSKLAASALLLALKMKSVHEWSPNLQYASGYELEDLKDLTKQLNSSLHKIVGYQKLLAVKQKYSHTAFFEVTKISLINILAF